MPASWETEIARYVEFLRVPTIRGKRRGRGPETAKVQHTKAEAENIARNVRAFIRKHPSVASWTPQSVPERYMVDIRHEGGSWRPSDDSGGWHWWRMALLERDDYCCYYCGRHAFDSDAWGVMRMEIEHLKPQSRYKRESEADRWSNLAMACRSCNVMKGQRSIEAFTKELVALARAVSERSAKILTLPDTRNRSALRATVPSPA